MPKSLMSVRRELAFARQTFKGLALTHRLLSGEVIDDPRRQYEKSAVDPAASLRLLPETCDLVSVCNQGSKASRWGHGSHCGQDFFPVVMVDKSLEVDIGNTITIGEVEFFIAEIGLYALEPSAGHCFQSFIHKSVIQSVSFVLLNIHTV